MWPWYVKMATQNLLKLLLLLMLMLRIMLATVCYRFGMWFVFELVIWPQEVTLARWTQPSGPLRLWQCFLTKPLAYFERSHESEWLRSHPSLAGVLLDKELRQEESKLFLECEVLIQTNTWQALSFWESHEPLPKFKGLQDFPWQDECLILKQAN